MAWLFNLRGGDVPYNPVFLSYGVVTAAGTATLYVDGAKVTPEVAAHLAGAGVEVKPYADLFSDARAMAAAGTKLWMDPARVGGSQGWGAVRCWELAGVGALHVQAPEPHACLPSVTTTPLACLPSPAPPPGQLRDQAGGAGGGGGRHRQEPRRQPQARARPKRRGAGQRLRGCAAGGGRGSGEAQPGWVR